jgi:AcrR family transcriptional regulator
MDAARELIADGGVESLRVGAMTERADVALGSFYNHFESKDEVVEAIVTETIGSIAGALTPLIASLEDPAEAVSVSNRLFVRLAIEDPQLARLLVNLERADARFETMVLPQATAALERGVEAGRFDFADDAVVLAVAAGGALAVMRGMLEGRFGPEAEAASTEGLLRSVGIGIEEAREIAARPLPSIEGPVGT